MNLTLIHVLGVVTASLSVLLGVFIILYPRYGKKGRFPLAAVFFLHPLFVLAVIIFTSFDLAMLQPWTYLVPQAVWLIGPLFYFHVRGLVGVKPASRRLDVCHFLPFAATSAYHFPLIYDWWQRGQRWRMMPYSMLYMTNRISKPLLLASILSLLAYVGFCLYRLYRIDSSPKTIAKNALLYGSLLVSVFMYFFFFYSCQLVGAYELAPIAFNGFFIATGVAIVAYLILFIKIPGLFLGGRKYLSSTLSPGQRERHRQKLMDCLLREKPYRDPDLTLEELSRRTDIPRSHLSQIINESFRKSYPDFINQFRIEECKRMLGPAGGGAKIIDIMFSAGFNSKSAFNSSFKKAVGLTPRQYRTNACRPLLESRELDALDEVSLHEDVD